MDKKLLVDKWIELQSLPQDSDEANSLMWAAEEFFALTDTEPQECWDVILEVVNKTDNEWVLTNLAAGPLEDLLALHPNESIVWLEREVPKNPRLKSILSGVWKNLIPDDVWERVQAL